MPTAAPLRARDLTVVRGPLTVLDGVDLVVAPGRRIGVVGPNGVGKSTLLRALAGLVPLERGRVERTPPTATVGYLPQEPSRSADETVDRVPRPPHRRDRGDGRDGRRDRPTWPPGPTAPTTATPTRSSAGWRSAAPTSTPASGRCGPTSGWRPGCSTSRRRRCRAARRRGRRWPRCCWPASTCSCSTSRRTTSTSTGSTGWSGGSPRCRRPSCSSATTARSSPAPSPTSSSSTSSATGRRHFGGGWQAFLDERETARRAAWERFEEYDAKRKGLAGRAQREREWATQGLSKAKKSDEPDKNIRAFKINQTEQLAGRAARTEKAMERLEAVDKPREPWQLRLTVASAGRSGDVVARLDGAVVERGSFTLGPIDLLVGRRRAHRARRRQRLGQDDAARRHPRAGRARRRAAVDRARASSSARSSRPATGCRARARCCGRSRTRPVRTPPTCARCWPSSASSPTTSPGRRARCRRASGRGRRWRC